VITYYSEELVLTLRVKPVASLTAAPLQRSQRSFETPGFVGVGLRQKETDKLGRFRLEGFADEVCWIEAMARYDFSRLLRVMDRGRTSTNTIWGQLQ
jgi:hypothetical protein